MKPWVGGIVIGLAAGFLVLMGNPENMGICVACFERDIAGAMGLHTALPVQNFRPEIMGLILGAFLASLFAGEFAPRGASAPVTRLLLGFFGMIGALVFLGCPWRAFLRLAGGDLNSLIGIAGLAGGIITAVRFNGKGFSLGEASPETRKESLIFPILAVIALIVFLLFPSFGSGKPFFRSTTGPGSISAPFFASLFIALVVGFVGFRSRFCSIAAFRNAIFFKERSFLYGVITLIITAFAVKSVSLLLSNEPLISFGFRNQPVSHSNYLWNFLGMYLVGFCFSLGEGCPGRQLFKAGSGDLGSVLVVTGMIIGAAFAHNFGLTAVPDKIIEGATVIGGPSTAGMAAVVVGILYCIALGYSRSRARQS